MSVKPPRQECSVPPISAEADARPIHKRPVIHSGGTKRRRTRSNDLAPSPCELTTINSRENISVSTREAVNAMAARTPTDLHLSPSWRK